MLNLPSYSTTMIGSMPHQSPDKAMELLHRYPLSIPVWPQLPKSSFKEAMIPQYCEGFPGILINEQEKKISIERNEKLMDEMTRFYEDIVSENLDAFSISPEHAAGFHYFLDELKTLNSRLPFIKGQVTGPFTFGLGLNDQDGRAVWFDPQYKDIVLKGLTMKALWQIKELKKYSDNIIIFLDEPIFSALGTPAYISINDDEVIFSLNEIIHALQKTGTFVGIHCCGNMDWALLTRTDVDIINFDAYFYGEKLSLYPDEIISFLNRNGILAWGIVPTVSTGEGAKISEETVDSLTQRLEGLIDIFIKKNISEEKIQKQMILTPSCGMGSILPEAAELVLNSLGKIFK